jgi:iron complex outermembrane receptor protein
MASNKTLLLSTTMFAGFLLAAPAFAQTATTTPPPAGQPAPPIATQPQTPDEAAIAEETAANPEAPASADGNSDAATVEGVVVTGSRLRRTEFTSAAPIQVITSESAELEGNTDIAEVLQQSSLAAGSQQLNNTFTGLLVNGGGGVNTISLRGLGSTRTLVLMNGRRLPPAGTQGGVAAVDLNILPNTAIERTEILKDGASSIYGSDAVAGVVNVITRKNLDGFVIDADVSEINKQGGGERYSAGLAWGKLFERGRVQLSGEYYKQNDLSYGDRPDFFCEQGYVFSLANGTRADLRTRTAPGRPAAS